MTREIFARPGEVRPDLTRTVLARGGRRVLVTDSVSFAARARPADVVVTGSHGGLSAGEYARRFGLGFLVCNDAGVGRNGAGVAGLRALDETGVLGVAVGHRSARIGDGADGWACGVITFVNETARGSGLRRGTSLREAVGGFLDRPAPVPAPVPGPAPGGGEATKGRPMLRQVVHEEEGRKVIVMDSISLIGPGDVGHVVVAGSNGGMAAAAAARAFKGALVVLNDAGIGKDEAGVAGVRALDADAIPAVAVGHLSAEISDGRDTWENGVLSCVNETAARAGLAAGQPVRAAVLGLLEASHG
ncbi:hypothetical protein [Streptosporangium longisporum]|uniref:Uncharacterized protein n=1 Tax=Streptosporangium longisporum TaxID=46187 RepID=A0ABN3XR33_9ACTN